MTRTGSILWRRLDLPGHEAARLSIQGDEPQLAGSAVFLYERQPCRLDYHIICDQDWRTRSAWIAGWIGEALVEISISADAASHWILNGAAQPAVSGCIDLDLNFSPSTNLLPVRRLELPIGESAAVRAAWVRFPDFKLEPLEQFYRRLDQLTYRYESSGGAFIRDLMVNPAGFVTLYPGVWEAEGIT